MLKKVSVILLFCLTACWQYDPKPSWKDNARERKFANQDLPTLTEKGELPAADGTSNVSPIMQKYQSLCATCHGADGKGDGPAASAYNPKPRNFVEKTWKSGLGKDKERIFKVIKLGVAGAGYPDLKNVAMTPWGGVLSDEEITQMVQVVQSFK